MGSESHIIGIDLGTTNSVVAIVLGNEPEVIPNTEGSNKTPSVVAFLDSGEVVVGEMARRQAATNARRTISSVKRLMGRSIDDVEESGEAFSYQLVAHESEMLIDVDGMGYRPEQISAIILKKLKESAEAWLGEEVTRAVIAVPAYFDDLQRQATIDAAEMAGLEVLRLINEPTAAAMAYGLGRSAETEEIIAVYDWGGGTFDITILQISGKTFEVLTSSGDSHLGGDDLDIAISNVIVDEFYQKHGVDLMQDPVTIRRLREVSERAKCELSSMAQTTIALPFIAYKDGQPLHLERVFRRREFEDLIEEFVRRTIRACKAALEDANLSKKDVNRIILVGGTTRIPMVQDAVEEFFNQTVYRGVNPDEVVALGAATQAGIFEGNVQEVVLLDVTPHSLGIEVEGGRFSKIIDKNSTIPIKAAKTFTTTEDNQQFVNIHVLQGESEDATENRSLGKFSLTGIGEARAGVPRIRVTFFINADGVAEISAEDMSTGSSEQISIIHSQLTEEERSRRSRSRSRANKRRFSPGARRGAAVGRARDTKRVSEQHAVEGKAITRRGSMPAALTETPPPGPPSDTHHRFAVLGDTRPSEIVQGVRARDNAPRSLDPVDYSRVPPMYTTPVPDGQRREVPPPPKPSPLVTFDEIILPQEVTLAVEMAERNDETGQALKTYAAALQLLDTDPFVYSNSFGVQSARAILHSISGQVEEARAALQVLREHHIAKHDVEVLRLHDLVLDRFNTRSVLRDRALARKAVHDYIGASNDIEQAMRLESHEEDAVLLEELYRARIAGGNDPQAMFRLVKILLKNNSIDEAISVLEELRQYSTFEARALKVLGLCHWQKNMHLLAWQQLKQLPLDEDMKDILYRLAGDIEATDQLANAVQVLEHLQANAPGYRDVEARLRKLNYRLKLQLEEEQNQKSLPVLSRDSRFTILEEINRGSMGIIYKAKDRTLNEIVALKVLNDYLCSDPAAVERFKSEARAAKKLSHPYIVRIHDLFELENKRFLSMEYIEGRDLKRLISERTTFPEDQIIYFVLQVCDALSYAHKLGIVHRDIKPANIMITDKNTIKITDFGIAKILRGEEATKSGTAVIGTPLYMAPEQIIGEDVDGRTDIYSLGIMMYEMVAGNPPFYLGNIEYHHIHTAPPALPERASPRLRQVIMRMIEKDPRNRYQVIDEAVAALKQ